MAEKKRKCVDCGLSYKERDRYGDGQGDTMNKPDSCFNCAFIHQVMDISAMSAGVQMNRKVEITLKISKIK